MNTFTFDGTVFDLTRTYADVLGIEWTWTGNPGNGKSHAVRLLRDTAADLREESRS